MAFRSVRHSEVTVLSAEQCRLVGQLVSSLHGAKHLNLEESQVISCERVEKWLFRQSNKNPTFPNSVVWNPRKQDRSRVFTYYSILGLEAPLEIIQASGCQKRWCLQIWGVGPLRLPVENL